MICMHSYNFIASIQYLPYCCIHAVFQLELGCPLRYLFFVVIYVTAAQLISNQCIIMLQASSFISLFYWHMTTNLNNSGNNIHGIWEIIG